MKMVLNFGGKHLFISTKHWVQKFEMIILRGCFTKKIQTFHVIRMLNVELVCVMNCLLCKIQF